jgi:hypothetical protein
MKRVVFQMHDFTNFVHYVQGTDNDSWEQDFIEAGFKTILWDGSATGGCSLSEEDYTWFVLKWG